MKNITYNVLAYVDSNICNEGKYFLDVQIITPSKIKNYEYDLLLIFSTAFEEILNICINELDIPREKIDNTYYFSKINLINRLGRTNLSKEKEEIVKYLSNNPLEVFNYPFVRKYKNVEDKILFDDEYRLYYTEHNNKKMYFSRKLDSVKKAALYYKSILVEQDIDSPHRYMQDEFYVKNGDVVVDVGVAEGNFALEIIDLVKKIYLIECDDSWIEALKITFGPYKEKVIIIEKELGNKISKKETTLDELFPKESINFLKMDIEGAEIRALQGAKNVLERSDNLKTAICCYHNHGDEEKINQFFEGMNFSCMPNKGYMIFLEEDNYLEKEESLELRRGLIKAVKNQ